MALFNWDDKFITGIAEIDNQHKKLIALVNVLHDAMKNRSAKELIAKLLQDLADYTVYHFGFEEKAFDRYAYADRETHKKFHAEFVNKVGDLIERQKKSEIFLSIDMLNLLIDWVRNHILVEDMKYLSTLKGKDLM